MTTEGALFLGFVLGVVVTIGVVIVSMWGLPEGDVNFDDTLTEGTTKGNTKRKSGVPKCDVLPPPPGKPSRYKFYDTSTPLRKQ